MADPLGALAESSARRTVRQRQGKELDLADRLVAAQRRSGREWERGKQRAAPDDRPPQPPPPRTATATPTPHPPPTAASPRRPLPAPPPAKRAPPTAPTAAAAVDPYARPAAPPSGGRLFNPNVDPIPSVPHPHPHPHPPQRPHQSQRPYNAPPQQQVVPVPQQQPAAPQAQGGPQQRQLFDPQRHDPLRFSVLNRAHAHQHSPSFPPAQHSPTAPSHSLPPTTTTTAAIQHQHQQMQTTEPRVFSGLSNATSSTSQSQALTNSATTGSSAQVSVSTPATSAYMAGVALAVQHHSAGGMMRLPPGMPALPPHPHPSHPSHTHYAPSSSAASSASSSDSSSLHLSQPVRPEDVHSRTGLVNGMKILYREIDEKEKVCERVLKGVEEVGARAAEGSRGGERGREGVEADVEGMERERRWWLAVLDYHEELADSHHAMYRIGLHPLIPGSLERLITKYTLPQRLWTRIWHLLRVLIDRARSLHPPPLPAHLTLYPPSVRPSPHPNPRRRHRPTTSGLRLTPQGVARELAGMAFEWAYELYGVLWEESRMAETEQFGLRVAWSEAMGDLGRFRGLWGGMEEVRAVALGGEGEGEGDVDMDEREEEEEDERMEMDEEEDERDSLSSSSSSESGTDDKIVHPSPRHAHHLHPHTRLQARLPHAEASTPLRGFTPNPASASHRPFPPHQPPASHPPLPHTRPASPLPPAPVPSIGAAAALAWGPIVEADVWRTVAREWYWRGLGEMPGVGRLQHHLGLLEAERERDGGEEGETRVVYHFLKSLTTSQPYLTARESVLPLFNAERQRARAAPGASTSALFVLMHGMLYTRVQLDDFFPTKARFEEQLALELADPSKRDAISEAEWIMWGVMCLAACAEYGREDGVIRKAEGRLRKNGQPEPSGKEEDEEMEDVIDAVSSLGAGSTPTPTPSMEHQAQQEREDYPLPFRLALQLTFDTLAIVARHPYRRAPPYYVLHLNPFIVMLFTFLSTLSKSSKALGIVERYVAWEQLARLVQGHVSRVLADPKKKEDNPRTDKLTASGILPEDWALRGMDWVTRRVYNKGFWDKKPQKITIVHPPGERNPRIEGGAAQLVAGEADTLALGTGPQASSATLASGLVEVESESLREAWEELAEKRWKRVMGACAILEKRVRGWQWEDGRGWVVGGLLSDKLAAWREEEERERREEEERRMRRRDWDDGMDVDGQVVDEAEEPEDEEEDEAFSEVIHALKAKRRQLREELLRPTTTTSSRAVTRPLSTSRSPAPRLPIPERTRTRAALHVLRGYTILVLDTNVVLGFLGQLQALIEGLRWTVVVPLPVVGELVGLSSDQGRASNASEALEFIKSRVRSHSKSLKVQTSKGNYLPDLSITNEILDFSGFTRNIDGLVLDAAAWQMEHFVDRSRFLADSDEMQAEPTEQTSRVVLLTLDRIMRVRARGRQIDVASPAEIGSIMRMS